MSKECCVQLPNYAYQGKDNVSEMTKQNDSIKCKLYRLFQAGQRMYSEYAKFDKSYF